MKNKTLKKSENKFISGICAGIADYLGWKPANVRIIFVIAAILGASSLLAYIILYFVMPNSDIDNPDTFNIENFRT